MSDSLSPQTITNIEDHLRSRGLDPSKTQIIVDKESNIATFLLYNLSGQLVGYHRYNPNGDKKARNNIAGKYFTYVTKESDHSHKIAVWGTETIKPDNPNLFVTEGVFDAIKLYNMGLPVIAVLSNNPKILKSWFAILNKKTIAITDNDEAGRKLGNLTDEFYTVPEPYKDLGEMPQEEVSNFITSTVLKQTRSKNQPETDKRQVIKNLLNNTVKNPETGNDILVRTALNYDKSHPAYKAARKLIDIDVKKHNIRIKSS